RRDRAGAGRRGVRHHIVVVATRRLATARLSSRARQTGLARGSQVPAWWTGPDAKKPGGTPGPGGYPRRSLTGAAGGPSTPCGGRRPGPAPQITLPAPRTKRQVPRNRSITPRGLLQPQLRHRREPVVTRNTRQDVRLSGEP